MRVLVTGADGFVGRHLCRYLRERGDEVLEVTGPSGAAGADVLAVDIRDRASLSGAVVDLSPDAIVHLAAISSVARSHREPLETFEINAVGTLNLCAAARDAKSHPRLLLVSSGEVYGPLPPETRAQETAPLVPMSPYAASKVAAEAVTMQFARSYGLSAVCVRPFSHIGPGQDPSFAIPSFARQIARARARGERAVLSVGDLEPVRDFSHVRDVVAAYRLLLERGISGETYNVCSGEGRSVRSLLQELLEIAGVNAAIQVDPSKVRPVEIASLVGDPSKIGTLGWQGTLTLRNALREILQEATATETAPS
jgi:GDP-4-dehydro-6-deoxy-D-mannose reductase